ncbi:16S rRNA (guanine(527)-N(7))-methyltransferase RsmG [Cognatazoarcus halotolerans]|uniref:16S rRNA (guanine(527)-N(7))-methyltransferase RsmG n=1 Tax=Cognatazoarcus halotolerans TaxID=2686016 RepID=UPI0013586A8B|nr:16S rRNA (guanine(527)-N(7))-methyltransferase RsmG [Cognatazoarcus halotolerans]MCB1898233.1 16S rRNA (guanine(527)-N(7))-methyltransferase RsmG [Rhodocyclaceae bacterium]MCP5311684.1 16S rRNA (guanine(527)-N(7))-methyltransferase RsmG [Zoogloeaceae bacterium]
MSVAASLARGLTEMRLELPPSAEERLVAFAELLNKWNRVYNLTAIRDPQQVVTHHLLDSLSVLPCLGAVKTLVDVGSGGGLPGIPLAIARPDLQVTSIETVSKKASFQQQAKIELGLDNFAPLCARVEKVRLDAPVDAVISRAFSDLADFVDLTAHLLAPEGRLYAMKGIYPDEELARLPAGFVLERAIELTVPDLDASRHLLVIRRES